MSTPELKKRLIEQIQITEDDLLLEEIYRLLDLDTAEIGTYTLNEEQIQTVAEAKSEINNGRFLSNEQANKDIDEWLGK